MYRILLDTNILVYFYDPRDPVKHAFAAKLLTDLRQHQAACLPVQALAEFTNLAPRKLAMTPTDTYNQVSALGAAWPVLPLTPAIVLEAARGVRDYQLAYYDAQIWATARLNQIPILFSEDFNAGAILESVQFVNPFLSSFRLADWV